MSTPIRFGVPGAAVSFGNVGASVSSGFASRMSGAAPKGIGAALASGVQTLGRQVMSAALGGLPPVVANLATNAASAAVGQLTGQDAAMMDMVDKCHTYLMMNSIFDAANAPIVERAD